MSSAEKKSENKALIAIICGLVMTVTLAYSAFALWCLWQWYIVPAFHVPLSYHTAVGINLILSWGTARMEKVQERFDRLRESAVDDNGALSRFSAHCLAYPTMLLAAGWAFHFLFLR